MSQGRVTARTPAAARAACKGASSSSGSTRTVADARMTSGDWRVTTASPRTSALRGEGERSAVGWRPLRSLLLVADGGELREHAHVLEGGGVTLGDAAGGDLLQQAAHDLAGASLRQHVGEADGVGAGQGADLLGHVVGQLLLEGVGGLDPGLQDHEREDRLALELVG